MRLLADENVPFPTIRLLREAGFDIEAIIEVARGSSDHEVLHLATEHDRIIVTFDRDFGELVYRRGSSVPPGIIYLRLSPADPEEPGRVLMKLFTMAEVQFEGRFTVVHPDRVRQRPFLAIE